ncbi:hypothetical protein BGZ80_009868 [Entomortierella chlamydospora]|uniref:Uncharacterized protein n=1 Tax=Entomortierella chlamydospora TaxID=101097 RepID=A0A9P6N2Z3_9FUNG|nr:hypothetical protein BGZ80_009868 [Entomortierella chlamydospora]
MTPQVKDFEAFLALDAPATPPPFPPQQHTPLPPSQQHTPSSTESFFEDISNLEDTINDSTTTTTLATPNPFSNVPLSPIQLVAISNLKLNNDMYSNRSLSIHRRILVKNFLTLLYQLSPSIDWMQHNTYPGDAFEPLPGLDAPVPDEGDMLLREDEQNGWMERTLSAAGLNDDDDKVPLGISSKIQNTNPSATTKSSPTTITTTTTTATSSSSAPPLLTLSFNTSSSSSASSSSASSNKSQQATLPRPKSAELPQTLHSYLSTVFDVDWSVELPSKEDILFTHAPSTNPSTSSSSPSPPISSVASKRKSISAASGLSSAFTAYSNGNASSNSAPSASPRSSTSSSFSSVSATSTVSSASSVGSIGNESTILIGYNKPGELNNGNNNLMGATKATPAAAILVRKSSLTSLSKPAASSTQAVNNPPANNPPANNPPDNNSVNNINGVLSENRNLSVKKASINGHAKPTLVPGRRSSLLQAGKIPPALPSTKNNNTSNNMGVNGLARANSVATTGETANSLSPAMSLPPSRSPTSLSPPTLSPPTFSSASTSPTLSPSKPTSPALTPSLPTSPTLTPSKPTISRRTSSLPSERPKPVQRALSSESNFTLTANATTLSVPEANIIGLPRPLLSPTLSSAVLSSSPPSQPVMTTSPTSTTPPASGATRYMRSASDDQFTIRPNNTPYALNSFGVPEKSPSSPNLYSSPPPPPPSAQSGALSRPTASYLKTSKSSPCLAGPESVSWDKSSLPPLPDQYYQQQYQSQASSDMLTPSHGTMISAPLSLIPNNPSYNDYAGYDGHNHNNSNNNTRPYGHGREHSYAQSMSNVSVTSNSSVMTNNSSKTSRSQVSEKPAAGRWSSMKTMFGLRGGQSTKG